MDEILKTAHDYKNGDWITVDIETKCPPCKPGEAAHIVCDRGASTKNPDEHFYEIEWYDVKNNKRVGMVCESKSFHMRTKKEAQDSHLTQ